MEGVGLPSHYHNMKLPISMCDISTCPTGPITITPTETLPITLCPCPEENKKYIDFITYEVSNTKNNYDEVLDYILIKKSCIK